MNDVVRGVVLRGVKVKDSDLMLTVYTHERGLMSIYAAHVLKLRNLPASCTDFSYSEFVIKEKGDKIWRESSSCIRFFHDDSLSLEAFTVRTYVSEAIMHVGTAEPDAALMQLLLNTFHAAGTGKYDYRILKAAFEVRLMSLIGFMPDLSACSECGNSRGDFIFDIMSGTVRCIDCGKDADEDDGRLHPTAILSEGARVAFDYCVRCPADKLFSFTLSDEDLRLFSRAAESYTVDQLDYEFITLDYFRAIENL